MGLDHVECELVRAKFSFFWIDELSPFLFHLPGIFLDGSHELTSINETRSRFILQNPISLPYQLFFLYFLILLRDYLHPKMVQIK